jgi:hypothetical protein
MGEIADWYEDIAFTRELQYHFMIDELKQKAEKLLLSYSKNKAKWETKNGKKIPVDKMEDSHVKNCLNLLVSQDDKSPLANAWIDIFKLEIKKRKL